MRSMTITVILLVASVLPVPVSAQVDGVATATSVKTLARQMNDLCVSMHNTFKSLPEFAEGYREAYELLQLAKQMDSALSDGSPSNTIHEQVSEFENEIHHVEHHISEFIKLQGDSEKQSHDTIRRQFQEVERTLEATLKSMGLNRKKTDANSDHQDSTSNTGAVDLAKLKLLSKELPVQMNRLCLSMHSAYKEMNDFGEAYREAYDLLNLSKQISQSATVGSPVPAIIEMVTDFDNEIRHTEHHLEEFATIQGSSRKADQDVVNKEFESVEATVGNMMKALGIAKKHDAHEHGEKTDSEVRTSQLAKDLSNEIGSFCNAMTHNYKNNPAYPEAYKEAYALFLSSKKICELTKDDTLTAECKSLLEEVDEEMHHMEEHVNDFKADDKGGSRRINRKMADVEKALHAMMTRADLKRKHAH